MMGVWRDKWIHNVKRQVDLALFFLCVQWYCAVCNGLLLEQESNNFCLISSLSHSLSSSSIQTFCRISSSFPSPSLLPLNFFFSFFLSNQWSLFIMLMFLLSNAHTCLQTCRDLLSTHHTFSQSYGVPFWDPWHDAFLCLAQFAILLLGLFLAYILAISNDCNFLAWFPLLVRIDNQSLESWASVKSSRSDWTISRVLLAIFV